MPIDASNQLVIIDEALRIFIAVVVYFWFRFLVKVDRHFLIESTEFNLPKRRVPPLFIFMVNTGLAKKALDIASARFLVLGPPSS